MLFCPPGIRAAKLTLLQADPFVKQKFCACCSLLRPSIMFQTFKSEFYAKPKLVWHAFLPFLVPGQQLQCCSSLGGQRHRNIDLSNEEGKLFLGHRHPTQSSTVSLSLLRLPRPRGGHDFWRYSCMESMEISIFSDYVYFPFISLF